jgi:cytidine deaminase
LILFVGAICAERAALVQLRLIPNPIIKKVVIVTDSMSPIAPGALCREYLMSHAHPDTDVVIASCCGEKVTKCKLGELYPHPYQYRVMKRYELLNYASIYSSTLSHDVSLCHEEIHSLHRKALEVVQNDALDIIHPIKFSAAVLYKNNDVEVAWFLKAMEYGNSLDPVSQLLVGMERRKQQNKKCLEQMNSEDNNNGVYDENYSIPHIILMTDQFGVCHAPFASARTLLNEHGYSDVLVVVHHHPTVCYQTCRVSELLPVPDGIAALSHDDFLLVSSEI